MAFGISNIIGGIAGGLAGGAPQNSTVTTNGTQNTTGSSLQDILTKLLSNTSSTGTATTTNDFGAAGNDVVGQILPVLSNLLGQSTDLSGYESSGASNINSTSDMARQAAQASLAARGLSTSPVAATTDANINAQRTSQIAALRNSIPLLGQQLKTQALGTAGNILGLLPRATTQTQNQDVNTSQSNQSQARVNQNQLTNTNQTQKTSSGGGFLSGLAGALAGLL